MKALEADITVVGGGIAGLWAAKDLLDQGLSVTVVERAPELACGPTTRNEGWLHDGTYHAVAVQNEADAMSVTARTRYGHAAILGFAPEAIDHHTSFAFTTSDELTERAATRWDMAGVGYDPVSPDFLGYAEGIDTARVRAAFRVGDKSVNSVTLCTKLAEYIIENGGDIITDAQFMPRDDNSADLIVDGEQHTMHSDRFVITAGAGIRDLYQTVTGRELLMRFFQAHLLIAPRLTNHNYFFLDNGEAGIMNHGLASIVGINRDGIELDGPSHEVSPEKERLVYEALVRMLPRAADLRRRGARMTTVACCKPDIYRTHDDTQSLNPQVFEPVPGYIFALPGKMTEAPFLAQQVVAQVEGDAVVHHLTLTTPAHLMPRITPRPADQWLQQAA